MDRRLEVEETKGQKLEALLSNLSKAEEGLGDIEGVSNFPFQLYSWFAQFSYQCIVSHE